MRATLNRRRFLQTAGCVAALDSTSQAATQGISILTDPSDAVAASAPARWAAIELVRSLASAGVTVNTCQRIADVKPGNLCIVSAGSRSVFGQQILKSAAVKVPEIPESLGLIPGTLSVKPVLLATGFDARGLVYSLLELADRVQNSPDALRALNLPKAVIEQPFNKVRGIARLFTSDVEDKPWYNDREMWPQYMTMLASNRYNRFHLAFGIGYD